MPLGCVAESTETRVNPVLHRTDTIEYCETWRAGRSHPLAYRPTPNAFVYASANLATSELLSGLYHLLDGQLRKWRLRSMACPKACSWAANCLHGSGNVGMEPVRCSRLPAAEIRD